MFKIKCKKSFELHVLTLNLKFNDCLKCLAQIYVVWYFGIYLQILLNSVRHKSKWFSFSYRVIIIDNLIIKSLLQEWLIAQVYLWAWELSGTKSFKKKNTPYLPINFSFFDYSKAISFITNVCIYVESIYVYVPNKEGFQRFLITSNESNNQQKDTIYWPNIQVNSNW